jgi:hypothetical protein
LEEQEGVRGSKRRRRRRRRKQLGEVGMHTSTLIIVDSVGFCLDLNDDIVLYLLNYFLSNK